MEATESYNEVGMVCRNESHQGEYGIFDGEQVRGFPGPGRSWSLGVQDVSGDWTRIGNIRDLGPITKLDDLPRVDVGSRDSDWGESWTLVGKEGGRAILVDDLTGRCLTRSEGERSDLKAERDTLTASVAELEGEVRHWKSNHDNQVRIKQESKARFDTRRVFELEHKLRAAETELATLREQCVLESLSPKELKDYRGYVLAYRNEAYWVLFFWSDGYRPESGTVYFRWTPPVLPEPEPEAPEVPETLRNAIGNAIVGVPSRATREDAKAIIDAVCRCPELLTALNREVQQ